MPRSLFHITIMMMTFDIPAGFEIPPDAKDEFTVVAKVKRAGDGKLTLVEIDGSPLGDEKEEPGDSDAADEGMEGESPAAPAGAGEGATMMDRMRKAGFNKSRIGG